MPFPKQPGTQRSQYEYGVVTSTGSRPTILSYKKRDIVTFAYRVVKRLACEPRHHFEVGDRVKFRRCAVAGHHADQSRPGKADQVWLLSPTRPSPADQVAAPSIDSPTTEGNAPTTPTSSPDTASTEKTHYWRYDPYSLTSNTVDVSQSP